MQYLGLQSQIWRNNVKSTTLLVMFPALLLALTWSFIFLKMRFFPEYEEVTIQGPGSYRQYANPIIAPLSEINEMFWNILPWIIFPIAIWFFIAYFANNMMIQNATGSHALSRKENKRVYNLLENLCITIGMQPPKINIIEDDSLNAFASGINKKSYTISLSRGIINKLNDEELKGVIAHELSHIQNRDVRLLIISIIFVGIFAFLAEMFFRMAIHGGRGSDKKGGQIIVIGLILAPIAYLLSLIFRFALSQKREYLADAGAVEITKNPNALADALRKVSQDARIEAVTRKDVAQLFIESPEEKSSHLFSLQNLFATHPPIEKRIAILKQF